MKMAHASDNGLEYALLALILMLNSVGCPFICEAHVMLG